MYPNMYLNKDDQKKLDKFLDDVFGGMDKLHSFYRQNALEENYEKRVLPLGSFHYIPSHAPTVFAGIKFILNELNTLKIPIKHFCDFGAGIGVNVLMVQKFLGLDSYGIELSDYCLGVAKEKNIPLIKGNMFDHTKVKEGTFCFTYMPIHDPKEMARFSDQLWEDMPKNCCWMEVLTSYKGGRFLKLKTETEKIGFEYPGLFRDWVNERKM